VTTAASILSGAVLLFTLEPMIAKMILPWFGGTAEVWTACLLFYQAALFGGYLYAHALAARLGPSRQRIVHCLLLWASLALLPISPSPLWKPTGSEAPLPLILGLLAATIGLPFVLLSATSPLLQVWYTQRRAEAREPYRLFALSNFGSLAGLVLYPFLIEPALTTTVQARTWSAVYGGFVLCVSAAGWLTLPSRPAIARTMPARRDGGPIRFGQWCEWLLLAAAPSALLLAVTNHITQNVAALPLVWIPTLFIYLLSFILCFEGGRWYRRPLFLIALAELLPVMLWATVRGRANGSLIVLVPLYLAGLFCAAMVCHGELAARRPPAGRLTVYYLAISLGGTIGGLAVAAVAPVTLDAVYDLPIVLSLTGFLVIAVLWRAHPAASRFWLGGSLAVLAAVTLYTARAEIEEAAGAVLSVRDFYAALRVVDAPATPDHGAVRRLMHGTISHGDEFLDPARAEMATTYYGRRSGVGRALTALGRRGPLEVGIIGLGAGTLASYCRPGDTYRYYEIDRQVAEVAQSRFHFLAGCAGQWNIALGDGRLRLEAESPNRYDILVVDAFSGDAVPVHLLTREVFALYWRHIAPDGLLVVHVSNEHLNLAPVVAAAAAEAGRTARFVRDEGDSATDAYASEYVIVARDPQPFDEPELSPAKAIEVPVGFQPWTDDYSNLLRSLR
jgi:hypothetical protein